MALPTISKLTRLKDLLPSTGSPGSSLFSTHASNTGAVNAGLSVEEHAAKTSLSAPQFPVAGLGAQAGNQNQMPNSQNSSALCPYDADIGQIKLENRKIECRTGRKPETPWACKLAGKREKSVFQRKKWQCQRHMVIVHYVFNSKLGDMQ